MRVAYDALSSAAIASVVVERASRQLHVETSWSVAPAVLIAITVTLTIRLVAERIYDKIGLRGSLAAAAHCRFVSVMTSLYVVISYLLGTPGYIKQLDNVLPAHFASIYIVLNLAAFSVLYYVAKTRPEPLYTSLKRGPE